MKLLLLFEVLLTAQSSGTGGPYNINNHHELHHHHHQYHRSYEENDLLSSVAKFRPTSDPVARSVSSDRPGRSKPDVGGFSYLSLRGGGSSVLPPLERPNDRPPSPDHLFSVPAGVGDSTSPASSSAHMIAPSSFESLSMASPPFNEGFDRMGSPLLQLFASGDRGSPSPFLTSSEDMPELLGIIRSSISINGIEDQEWTDCMDYLAQILLLGSQNEDEQDQRTLDCVWVMQEKAMEATTPGGVGGGSISKGGEAMMDSPRSSHSAKQVLGKLYNSQSFRAPGNVEMVMMHYCAYLVSRHLYERVQNNVLRRGSIPRLEEWPDVLEEDVAFKKTFIPLTIVQVLKGLIPIEDSSYEFTPAEEALYLTNFFIPGGERFMKALRQIDASVSLTIRHFVFNMPLRKEPIQHKAALHMAKMVLSPSLQLAAEMPAFDVDPPNDIALAIDQTEFKESLTWSELMLAWQSLRVEWPHTEMDSEGIFGIDCLVLRLLAKSLWTGNESQRPLDGVQILKSNNHPSDPIPLGTLVHFARCLANSDSVDMVALPMMIYHLISPQTVREDHFDPLHLLPLMKMWFINLNTVALDRAAKLRAALYFKPPQWWISLRSETIVIASMFPSFPFDREDEDIVPSDLASLFRQEFQVPDSIIRFEALKITQCEWFKSLETKPVQIQVMTAVLEFLASGILANGDWINEHKWIYVVGQFVDDFNHHNHDATRFDNDTTLSSRIAAVAKICRIHLRSEQEREEEGDDEIDLESLFDPHTLKFIPKRLESVTPNTALACAILEEMSTLIDIHS